MQPWVLYSIIGMVGLIPVITMTSIAAKHFAIQPDVTAILWFGSATVGMVLYVIYNGRGSELLVLNKMGGSILILGLTLGAVANIAIFLAFAAAPNPGLPIGIVNANAVLAFIIAAILAKWLPGYFEAGEFSLLRLSGIFLTITGIVLISLK